MSRLFESFEKLDTHWPYGRISPRLSLFYAMMSAFFAGAEMTRIIAIIRPHRQVGDLVEEGASLALWLAFGVLSGRAALDRLNH
jgi:hypothetical protein